MKIMYKKNRYNNSRRAQGKSTDINPVFESSDVQKTEGNTNLSLEIKAMKNLAVRSITVQADPYQASLPASFNYPLQAKYNAKISPSYTGEANLDGGNVQQYVNGLTSKLLKAIDYFYFKPAFNYGYAPMSKATLLDENGVMPSNYVGKELIDQRRDVWAEVTSVLGATTYTALAINDYAVLTDMPMGSAPTESIGGVPYYTNVADVLYATTTFYQLVLQAAHTMIKQFNSLRYKQGNMLRSDFNRAVSGLNSYFTQINKSAMDGIANSLAKAFPGEYFDIDFSKLVNHFIAVPSRAANDLFHPYLEMGAQFSAPSQFVIALISRNENGTPSIISSINLFDHLTLTDDWFGGGERPLDIFQLQSEFSDFVSAEKTAKWARAEISQMSAIDRSNYVKYALSGVSAMLNSFKPKVADIREALDVLTRANLVRWVKGYQPVIERDFDRPNFDYLLVNDCIKNAFSGATNFTFDNETKRWKTWTLWNMYYGIPEYDKMSGGAFLTASFKEIQAAADDDSTLNFVPTIFDTKDTLSYTLRGYMINRDGEEFTVMRTEGDISEFNVFKRLAVLRSMESLNMRVPTVADVDNDTNMSMIYFTLLRIFGMGLVTGTEAESTMEMGLDPDIISEYLIEVSDITNEALTYARNQGIAVKGGVTKDSVLGFSIGGKN